MIHTRLLCLLCLFPFAISAAQDKPANVVLIFVDDLGYGDVGCYGATKVQTPNIDRLAKEGRRFTDAHSASAVCTPSRYGLLTGEYPLRALGGKGLWGPAPITSPLLLNPEKRTIADLFKSAGYDTAVIGKWHLGFKAGKNDWREPLRPGPQDLGFDYYFGMPVVNSAPPYVYVENDRIVGGDAADPLVYLGRNAKGATPITPIPPEAANRVANLFGGAKRAHKLFSDYQVGTTFAKKSVEWIRDRTDKPFFLYLATTNIHHPFTPAKRFQGTSECGLYGDFIHELDWIVGEVVQALEEKGVADNTLIIFTSDNGGMFNHGGQAAFRSGHRINGDLLGFKFGVWEGGHRVPFIAKWPGKIKPGTTSSQMMSGVDLYATFAALTGQKLEKKQAVDSVNMLPALVGDPAEPIRKHLVLAPHSRSHLSMRKGKWMYIPRQGSGGFRGATPNSHTFAGPPAASFVGSVNSDIENGKIKKDAPPAQLYDLESDVNQARNVFREHPGVVKEIRELLTTYAPKRPTSSPTQPSPVKRGKPAKKIPAAPSRRTVSFDFETGTIGPWKITEGKFGHVIGSREQFFHNTGPYNKQGKHYLTTLEPSSDAPKGEDSQTGVIVSPMFIPEAGTMTFRVGGGGGPDTYVALCLEDGTELLKARGINSQTMQQASWDLTPYAGKKLFIKVVDRSTGGWGHVTVDHFEFDGEVLGAAPTAKPRASSDDKATRPPNFIVIFADDLGYGDIGCYGATKVRTPHIDKLAEQGRRFTDAHSASAVCSPSRYALMTGRYPFRNERMWGPLMIREPLAIDTDRRTLADVMKEAGYATACIGKWHLGFGRKKPVDWNKPLSPGPRDLGFDYYFGVPVVNSHPPFVYVENEGVVGYVADDPFVYGKPAKTKRHPEKFGLSGIGGAAKAHELYDDEAVGTTLTEKAVGWMKQQHAAGKPFFLYLSTTNIHHPFTPAKRFQGTSDCGPYGDFIHELDWMVGEVMKTLREIGADKDTLVVFTSDNGGMINIGGQNAWKRGHRMNGDLLGFKFDAWEGGHRVPMIARWPERIRQGSVSDQLICNVDLMATFAKLTDQPLGDGDAPDSVDMTAALLAEPTDPIRKELVITPRSPKHIVLRSGDWVFIDAKGNGGFGSPKLGTHLFGGPAAIDFAEHPHSDITDGKLRKDAPPGQLYNLADDPRQTRNVFADHPDVVKRMRVRMKQIREQPTTTRSQAERPNFIVVFADDLGYGDLGCFGSKQIRTPRIDRLAKEGMRFTSFYAQPVCGPSRAAIMTGCYPLRVAEAGNIKRTHPALHSKEITVAEVLKSRGYATGCFGKWDLAEHRQRGFKPHLMPNHQGFDYFFGTPTSNDGFVDLYRNENRIEEKASMATLTQRYTDEAIAFMERNKDKPFFVYIPHTMPHTRLDASEAFKGKSPRGLYGDVVEEIDHNVGRIVDAVKKMKLENKTYIVFTSDNGPWLIKNKGKIDGTLPGDHGGSAGPLRSGKVSTWEGGQRVPTVVWAPGLVPAGTTCDAMASTLDVLPTLAALSGAKAPGDRKIDGENIAHLLRGEFDKATDGKAYFYYAGTHLQAVRQGQWKLHLPRPKKLPWSKWSPNGHIAPADDIAMPTPQLYNLTDDIGETTDVAPKHSDVVDRLLKLAESARADIGDYNRIGSGARFYDQGPKRPGSKKWIDARNQTQTP